MGKRAPPSGPLHLFLSILELMRIEWKTTRSLNLGVRSGTGVGDVLIVQKLRGWAQELLLLIITSEEAGVAMAVQARKTSREELQQIQVLFDSLGLTELSDYIRVMVFNTGDPWVKKPIGKKPPACIMRSTVGGDGGRAQSPKRGMVSTPSTIRGGSGTSPSGGSHRPPTLPHHRLDGPDDLRFSGLLKENHPLLEKAKVIRASRRKTAADEDRAAGLDGSCKMGSGSGDKPDVQKGGGAGPSAQVFSGADYSVAAILGSSCTLRQELEAGREVVKPHLEYTDVEHKWRETNHTSNKDAVLDTIMMKPRLELAVPNLEKRRQEEEDHRRRLEEERSLAGSPSRGMMAGSSPSFMLVGDRAGNSFSQSPSPAGGRGRMPSQRIPDAQV